MLIWYCRTLHFDDMNNVKNVISGKRCRHNVDSILCNYDDVIHVINVISAQCWHSVKSILDNIQEQCQRFDDFDETQFTGQALKLRLSEIVSINFTMMLLACLSKQIHAFDSRQEHFDVTFVLLLLHILYIWCYAMLARLILLNKEHPKILIQIKKAYGMFTIQ